MVAAHKYLQPVDEGDAEALAGLITGVARGERDAAARFYDRFEAEVNRLVWALLGADADHDDLVNEAFQQMLCQVHRVRAPAALRGWVRRVTVNVVRQALRRRRWRRLFSGGEEEALQHPDLEVPDEATRERLRGLYRALGVLSADERAVLLLRHVQGYELTEAAEALGCSLATVKRWLARAEARARHHLETGGAP